MWLLYNDVPFTATKITIMTDTRVYKFLSSAISLNLIRAPLLVVIIDIKRVRGHLVHPLIEYRPRELSVESKAAYSIRRGMTLEFLVALDVVLGP